VKQILSNFAFDPHPQPLSQRERGEKLKNFSVPPLLTGEGVKGVRLSILKSRVKKLLLT